MRILILAARILAGFIEFGLEERGHEVRVAVDVPDAIRALEEEVHDVAILDFNPVFVSARSRLAETAGWKTPRLVLTSGDQDEALLAMALGDDSLVKPFPFEELCTKLDALRLVAASRRQADSRGA